MAYCRKPEDGCLLFMAKERYIHGKQDDAHHEGKASEVRRLDEAKEQIKDAETPKFTGWWHGTQFIDGMSVPVELQSIDKE